MRTFTYVIIDDDTHRAQKTLATAGGQDASNLDALIQQISGLL
ncbi:MAG: hypothetical protein ACOVP9_02335 [Flavobacterium stagni]